MIKNIIAIGFIFICTTVAWMVLAATTAIRSTDTDEELVSKVSQLWGEAQKQAAPEFYSERTSKRTVYHGDGANIIPEEVTDILTNRVPIDSSDISVSLALEHRKKGLLWYPTYAVDFSGKYIVSNSEESAQKYKLKYIFPQQNGIYDNFIFSINGDTVKQLNPQSGFVYVPIDLKPNESATIEIAYRSQGMKEWWYTFGNNVSQVKDFDLKMTTNFDGIDFPDNGMSPTSKEATADGWMLEWDYTTLISGKSIGLTMPQKLNPGPFVAKVTTFAPVSLFFFFFVVLMLTTIRKIRVHPMNYFFLAAAFFAFHLLMAYLVDHIDIHAAFAISAAVSVFLVISYMRLVVGMKFAAVEVGISQLIYLVLFSYAFFLEGFTGLAITICSILTLFVVMQYTGRIDWTEMMKWSGKNGAPPPPPPPNVTRETVS